MQLWNSLLLSIGPSQLVVCDNQLVNLCGYFLHRHATTIHRRRLRNNLLLHFTNLVDYGLLSAGQLRQLMVIYDKMITNHTTLNNAANNTGGSSRAMIGSSINGTITMTDASSMRSIEAWYPLRSYCTLIPDVVYYPGLTLVCFQHSSCPRCSGLVLVFLCLFRTTRTPLLVSSSPSIPPSNLFCGDHLAVWVKQSSFFYRFVHGSSCRVFSYPQVVVIAYVIPSPIFVPFSVDFF